MRLLALDAATEACSVALHLDGATIERTLHSGKSHSQHLLRLVKEVLAEAGVDLGSLDGIAASVGPGAFTGVRISVAVAQGIAFGAGLPAVAVSTLEALALQAFASAAAPVRAAACLDARMGEVYWGCYATDAVLGVRATCAPRVARAESLALPEEAMHVGIGPGFAAYPVLAALAGIDVPSGFARALPRAREFAQLGVIRLKLGGGVDPALLQPVYLRDKVALTEAERAAR